MTLPGQRPHCAHCGDPLGALDALQGHACRKAACRHQASVERWKGLRLNLGGPALHAAEAVLGRAPTALLWLEPAVDEIVSLPEERRQRHAQFLQGLVDAVGDEDTAPTAAVDSGSALGAQEGRLCAFCVGRCCAAGHGNHAFITRPLLLRWQQQRPGSSLQDAVQAYLGWMSAEHLRDGCVYQGAQGCTLPREDRADICNSFACGALAEVQARLAETPDATFVAVVRHGQRAVRQAAITSTATVTLPLPGSVA